MEGGEVTMCKRGGTFGLFWWMVEGKVVQMLNSETDCTEVVKNGGLSAVSI